MCKSTGTLPYFTSSAMDTLTNAYFYHLTQVLCESKILFQCRRTGTPYSNISKFIITIVIFTKTWLLPNISVKCQLRSQVNRGLLLKTAAYLYVYNLFYRVLFSYRGTPYCTSSGLQPNWAGAPGEIPLSHMTVARGNFKVGRRCIEVGQK